MNRHIVHPASEFGQLPWNTLKVEDCTQAGHGTGNWSFGRGGFGLLDSTWTIKIYQPVLYQFDGSELVDVWEVPEQLATIFQILKDNAADDVRRTIKNALEYTT